MFHSNCWNLNNDMYIVTQQMFSYILTKIKAFKDPLRWRRKKFFKVLKSDRWEKERLISPRTEVDYLLVEFNVGIKVCSDVDIVIFNKRAIKMIMYSSQIKIEYFQCFCHCFFSFQYTTNTQAVGILYWQLVFTDTHYETTVLTHKVPTQCQTSDAHAHRINVKTQCTI